MGTGRVAHAMCVLSIVIAGCVSHPGEGEHATPGNGPDCSAMKDRCKQQVTTLKQLFHPEKLAGPHLGEVYSRSASFHDGHRNPVIIIPGILGSRLRDRDSNRVVWGSFGMGSLNPMNRPDASLLALPMRQSVPLRNLTDHDYADSILSAAQVNLLGLPVEVDIYKGVLRTMGIGGYRNAQSNQATLDSISYGEDHYTCFEFHYDWRRDNAENAAKLGQFIREKAAYVRAVRSQRYGIHHEPVRFDIVSHSMGGLIARYYMRYGEQQLPDDGSLPALTWAGAKNVETLIQAGAPNAGSPQVILDLVDGKQVAPCLPKYSATILGTMPAGYQLMPRPRHAAVVWEDDCQHPVNLYDVDTWQKLGWGLLDPDQDGQLQDLLPNVKSRQQRQAIARDHIAKSLFRAKQFHQALDRPADPPHDTALYHVVGDSTDTISQLSVNPGSGRLTVVKHASGDGTVLRSSALMDERLTIGTQWSPRLVSPIKWQQTMFIFSEHRSLTSDPAFTDNVLNVLLELPRVTR